ncbi:MAG: hypothetical protein J5994_08805 [Ruminococcus sp.]|nr:hypothetical protein [Ruminococcus sp.]
MAVLESGVAEYITAQATVTVNFPVDFRGNALVACKVCPFLTHSTDMCQLTKELVPFPDKYVGGCCPLEIKEDKDVDI